MGESEDLRGMLRNLVESSEENTTFIRDELKRIEEKLDQILAPARVFILPDHLRPTMMAIQKLEEATATQVTEVTGRGRATESSYLNELVRMG